MVWFLFAPSISEISLTVAEEGRPTKESEKAHQIEKCDCPVGYSGFSCEVGFFFLKKQKTKPKSVELIKNMNTFFMDVGALIHAKLHSLGITEHVNVWTSPVKQEEMGEVKNII